MDKDLGTYVSNAGQAGGVGNLGLEGANWHSALSFFSFNICMRTPNSQTSSTCPHIIPIANYFLPIRTRIRVLETDKNNMIALRHADPTAATIDAQLETMPAKVIDPPVKTNKHLESRAYPPKHRVARIDLPTTQSSVLGG